MYFKCILHPFVWILFCTIIKKIKKSARVLLDEETFYYAKNECNNVTNVWMGVKLHKTFFYEGGGKEHFFYRCYCTHYYYCPSSSKTIQNEIKKIYIWVNEIVNSKVKKETKIHPNDIKKLQFKFSVKNAIRKIIAWYKAVSTKVWSCMTTIYLSG